MQQAQHTQPSPAEVEYDRRITELCARLRTADMPIYRSKELDRLLLGRSVLVRMQDNPYAN